MSWSFPKCLLDKSSWLMTSLSIFDDVTKTAFLSVSYTPATWTKQWLHELSSFHWGNPWYKFQVRNICTSWHTRVVCTSCTLIMAHKMCTLARVTKSNSDMTCVIRYFLHIKNWGKINHPLNKRSRVYRWFIM